MNHCDQLVEFYPVTTIQIQQRSKVRLGDGELSTAPWPKAVVPAPEAEPSWLGAPAGLAPCLSSGFQVQPAALAPRKPLTLVNLALLQADSAFGNQKSAKCHSYPVASFGERILVFASEAQASTLDVR